MLPVFTAELFVSRNEQHRIGHNETQGENLYRRKSVVQKHLGAYKTSAPEGDGHDGEQVPDGDVVAGRNHREQR